MIYASIGISQYTKDLDAVIDFLGILYREEKYGNILLYGKQDVDYKLKDGYVSDLDGTKRPYFYNFFEKLELNLFINTYPVQGEDFVSNRKEAYFSYYENVKMSPFVGFQPDYDKKGIISQDFDDFLDSLTNKTMDETVRKYSAKLKSDGIDEYIKSVREQWATYNK
jgi:multiple sugar transport system substrate-binding protein